MQFVAKRLFGNEALILLWIKTELIKKGPMIVAAVIQLNKMPGFMRKDLKCKP